MTATNAKYRSIVDDPLGGNEKVMRVEYKQGSYESSGEGGNTFYAVPPIAWQSASTVKFCYQVLFEEGFDFANMGKLPGLHGGSDKNCKDETKCWSSRYMWRQGGKGELYPTIDQTKQTSDFCTEKWCDHGKAVSLGRGNFSFTSGKWQNMCQIITATENGKIEVYSGAEKTTPCIDKVAKFPSGAGFTGIQFSTFFGGGPKDKSPKDQSTYFKDFSLEILN